MQEGERKTLDRWGRYLLGAAVLLYLLQAVPWLDRRWVEDESWYSAVGYALHTEGKIRNPLFADSDPESRVDPRPPLMPLTLATTFRLLGVGPAEARVPSVLAGLCVVVVTYFLGALLWSSGVGGIASLIVATDTWLLLTARTVRPDIYVAAFSILGVYLYFLARKKGSALLALGCGLVLGLSLNYHVNGLAAVASIGLLFLLDLGVGAFKDRRLWATAAGVVVMVVPTALWLRSSPDHIAAFQRVYGRGKNLSPKMLALQEGSRYSDLIGLSNKRFRLPIPAPVRLHLVLLALIGLALLFRYNRKLAITLIVLLAPGPILWVTQMNPAVRFFAIPAYVFALMMAGGLYAVAANSSRWKLGQAALGLVLLTQLAGNLYFLNTARKADYLAVRRGLKQLIPENEKVYGAITFFLALHENRFYSYNRTPLETAVGPLGVNYLILNDRVMLQGAGFWEDTFANVRETAQAFVKENAKLVGTVASPFYGDLEIYRVDRSTEKGNGR